MTIVYIIFILLAIYFSYHYDGIEENDSHKNHRFWFLCIYLICMSGFSYGLGGDKFVYMENFELTDPSMSYNDYIKFSSLFQGYMPGWSAMMLFTKRTFGSFYIIQFIQSTIINTIFCYIITKYTHRYFLFLLLYFISETFFQFNTEVMREAIAIAIMMLGLELYFSGKKSFFYIFIVFALLFHISAIVAVLFPFCRKYSGKKSTLVITFILALAVWFISDILLSKVLSLFFRGQGAFIQKIFLYSSQSSTIFGFVRNALRYLIFPCIIMFFHMEWSREYDSQEIFHKKQKLISFTILLGFLACSMTGFTRFQNYTQIYYLAFVSDFIYFLFDTKRHIIIKTATTLGASFLIILTFFNYWPGTKFYFYQFFIPYTCILNEDNKVYIRQEAHTEATKIVASDKNQREIKE